jgi:iron(III) transport system permease protein
VRAAAWPRRGAARRGPPPALTLAALLTVAAVALPVVYLVIRAAGGGAHAWGVLQRHDTLLLVGRTVGIVAAVTAAAIALGVPLAWLVVRTDLPGRRLWAVALALPLVIPSYVAALALLGAFGPRGLLQQALEPLGVERVPEIYGFGGAFLALTLSTYPYVLLLVIGALRGLDPALEEASRSLGRGSLETFLRVTLPALRPAVGVSSLLVALYVLADFGAVSLMQFDALTRAIYLQYRSLFDRSPAAVLSLVLVALTALILLLEARTRRRSAVYHRSGPGAARATAPVPLGRWRWSAVGLCGLVVTLFLAVPVGVLVYWLARGGRRGRGLDAVGEAALNSLLAAAVAAAVAVVAALPVALLAHRHPRPWSRALERASYTGNALPGVVIALSLVFFAANYAGWIYQTLALLVAAYVIRFLPDALAGVSSGLLTVSPRLEEAARGLGRSSLRVRLTVTVPLLRAGMLSGAALVFLSVMKELPATLLLKPIGFETLATEVWRQTSVASYSRAALPALVLIAIAAPSLYLIGRQGEPGRSSG